MTHRPITQVYCGICRDYHAEPRAVTFRHGQNCCISMREYFALKVDAELATPTERRDAQTTEMWLNELLGWLRTEAA